MVAMVLKTRLNNPVYPKKSAPRSTVLQKKVRNSALFLKKGTILVPFFQMGTVSEQKKKKVENSFSTRSKKKSKTVLVPLGVPFSLIVMFIKQYP